MFFATSCPLKGPFSLQRMRIVPRGKVLFISGHQVRPKRSWERKMRELLPASLLLNLKEIIRIQGTARGQNILHRTKTIAETASSSGIPEADLEIRLESIRARLFTARQQRCPPLRDDKVLTDWNGLFIAALAQAARTFGNEEYFHCGEGDAVYLKPYAYDRRRAPAPVS